MDADKWVDCSYQDEHRERGLHRPHPADGRVICWLCHPAPTSVRTRRSWLVALEDQREGELRGQ